MGSECSLVVCRSGADRGGSKRLTCALVANNYGGLALSSSLVTPIRLSENQLFKTYSLVRPELNETDHCQTIMGFLEKGVQLHLQ